MLADQGNRGFGHHFFVKAGLAKSVLIRGSKELHEGGHLARFSVKDIKKSVDTIRVLG